MAAGLYPSILSARISSMRTSVSRSFRIHVQVSKKRYIYTIDDDCFVAKTPGGDSINALEQHIRNLLTPSTPRFFNTLYDPFADGADFVRGYPFSWREGAPTAVSHGECLPFCCRFISHCSCTWSSRHAGCTACIPLAGARHTCFRCVFCDVVISGIGQHLEPLALKLVLLVVGLWLNIPDYDAPTQMVKPHERNTRYVDAVMTIPKVCPSGNLLLLFCNTNLAAL